MYSSIELENNFRRDVRRVYCIYYYLPLSRHQTSVGAVGVQNNKIPSWPSYHPPLSLPPSLSALLAKWNNSNEFHNNNSSRKQMERMKRWERTRKSLAESCQVYWSCVEWECWNVLIGIIILMSCPGSSLLLFNLNISLLSKTLLSHFLSSARWRNSFFTRGKVQPEPQSLPIINK